MTAKSQPAMNIVGIDGNEIVGAPKKFIKSEVEFKGRGNKLIIDEGCQFNGVIISFVGSNGVLHFGQETSIRGTFTVGDGCTIEIGANTRFNKPCRFIAAESRSITVGERCLFANIRFRTSDQHRIYEIETGNRINDAADIFIGSDVWLAEDVLVYKGARVGNGSIVGARSVVTRAIPANSLAIGAPAKVVRSGVTWSEKF